MFNLTKEELSILKRLKKASTIQDFISKIPINYDDEKDTCLSPREVLKQKKAHCIEGAMLAALALRINGHKPLIVDLTATDDDFDHVIAVFKEEGRWGAISKSNHAVLRYREPVYKSIRELVMSYFHEYFDDKGKKNLRSYSNPVDLSIFDKKEWITSNKDVWFVPEHLVKIKHHKILNKKQISSLRRAEDIEILSGKNVEWKKD
ncbi:MAG: transglutaminase-like domain-containing protein [Nanoarchaeota archaeon]